MYRKIAADAIMEYFIPNPDKEDKVPFVFKDGPCLTRDKWRQLQVQIHKAGLKEDDFFSALLGDNRPNDGGQLYIREPMFSVEGIQYVNSLYQETSILETIEV